MKVRECVLSGEVVGADSAEATLWDAIVVPDDTGERLHLVMHQDVEPGSKIVENQAHQFAAEFLAPTAELEPDPPRKVGWDALLRARKKWVSAWQPRYTGSTPADCGANTPTGALTSTSPHGDTRKRGPLSPPESPYLLGAVAERLSQAGTSTGDLAAASRLMIDHIDEIIAAGSETKPRQRLAVDPRP